MTEENKFDKEKNLESKLLALASLNGYLPHEAALIVRWKLERQYGTADYLCLVARLEKRGHYLP